MSRPASDGTPSLSVVVASFRAKELLAATLNAIRSQAADLGAEVIVSRAGPPDDVEWLRKAFPFCQVVACPPGTPLPAIRGAGLSASTGEWVALTEDNAVPDAGWLVALADARASGAAVLGGVMRNAQTRRAVDWGAFFAEFGFFGPYRRATLATGANVAYHRSIVPEVTDRSNAGAWEDVIHDRIAARGLPFGVVPLALVRQHLRYNLRGFCQDRRDHGRGYAAVRSGSLGRARRLLLAAGTTVLPLLLATRIWRATEAHLTLQFLRALPVTLVFLGAWALGEAEGYLFGAPREEA